MGDGYAYFGAEVRYAREHAGRTQKELAEASCYQPPYVSKVESGMLLGSEQFAQSCDGFFETSGYFVRLRERIAQGGHASWFVPYVQLERTATSILDYSPTLVKGLLQTEEYAAAVVRAHFPLDEPEVVQRKVDARVQRRAVMRREQPPLLWSIIHEACLRTLVGGRKVMYEQLRHLLAEAESPHATFQVMPFTAGAAASYLPFTLLTFDDGPGILYAETPHSGHVDESAIMVADMSAAYDRLRADAMSPDDSLTLIRNLMEEYAL